jgi:hypothetical protein
MDDNNDINNIEKEIDLSNNLNLDNDITTIFTARTEEALKLFLPGEITNLNDNSSIIGNELLLNTTIEKDLEELNMNFNP